MLIKINTYSHLQGEEYHQNWVHRTLGIPTEFKGGIRAAAMEPLTVVSLLRTAMTLPFSVLSLTDSHLFFYDLLFLRTAMTLSNKN
jgi:hypothetical protein